jgi:hypothetical protein
VVEKLYRDTVVRACKHFRSRLEAVMKIEGDFIE